MLFLKHTLCRCSGQGKYIHPFEEEALNGCFSNDRWYVLLMLVGKKCPWVWCPNWWKPRNDDVVMSHSEEWSTWKTLGICTTPCSHTYSFWYLGRVKLLIVINKEGPNKNNDLLVPLSRVVDWHLFIPSYDVEFFQGFPYPTLILQTCMSIEEWLFATVCINKYIICQQVECIEISIAVIPLKDEGRSTMLLSPTWHHCPRILRLCLLGKHS